MYLAFVQGHKNGERLINIEVDWWSPAKLRSKYVFQEVILGGELDYHLSVSVSVLREILDDNIHVYTYTKLTDGIRMLITRRAAVTDQIETLIAGADAYDELRIVLYYWQSMGGAF